MRCTQRILVGENETNILFGRPGRRWEDSINISCRNRVGHKLNLCG